MGLLKTGLKAAVAVKTADVIHERVLARQQEHAAAQGHPAPAAAVTQPGSAAPIAAHRHRLRLRRTWVTSLRSSSSSVSCATSGVLTDAEFEAQKAQILSA